MTRKPWDLDFTAEPTEVAALRRILRLHLGIWGLQDVVDDAQLCMSELVSNVITHVGPGTPATLAVSMNGVRLRIEVHDPDARALPTLLDANAESEYGRGMALVDAIAYRWGIQLHADQKVTWCELVTGLSAADILCVTSSSRESREGICRVRNGAWIEYGCASKQSST
ncbi:ATP-binding protein [Streptomyces sp. NPDC005329]|uniref:ATP-binding protein n=1 Tax=Streptomyces sp. NPDC005329 TaxID=3157034 RepID=UPI0033B44D51